MAVLCMVVLHLFYREGSGVFGTPLLWFNQDIPVVYWFGFYSEVCVIIYSICMGYAQYMIYMKGNASWSSTLKRILRLMINYWIILIMFSVAGIIYNVQSNIPGSLPDFLKSIVLAHSYNVAWWFLNSYILFLMIPAFIKFFPANRMSVKRGLLFCCIAETVFYLIKKTGIWSVIASDQVILQFVVTEIQNLLRILPSAWVGAFFYKGNVLSEIYDMYYAVFKNRRAGKNVLGIIWVIQFILMNILHKAVFNIVFGVLTFILFNLWDKTENTKMVFQFLGKHSTNIWLSHVFFYMTLFTGLVQIAKYPLFILAFTLLLCIITSYVEMGIERLLYSFRSIKNLV